MDGGVKVGSKGDENGADVVEVVPGKKRHFVEYVCITLLALLYLTMEGGPEDVESTSRPPHDDPKDLEN